MWLIPLLSVIAAAAYGIYLLVTWRRLGQPAYLVWGIALLSIALASTCLMLGSLSGWTPLLAKTYYLLGAMTAVGYLSLGTAYLLAPRPVAHLWLIAVAGVTVTAIVLLAYADIDRGALETVDDAGWKAVDPVALLPGLATALNSLGILVFLVAAAYAYVYKRLALANITICAGVLVMYYGGNVLSEFTRYEYGSFAHLLGLTLFFAGVLLTRDKIGEEAAETE